MTNRPAVFSTLSANLRSGTLCDIKTSRLLKRRAIFAKGWTFGRTSVNETEPARFNSETGVDLP